MAVTIKLPYYEGETGVTAKGYSEAGSLLQSGIALTESSQPGMYSGSLSFTTFPVGYYTIRIFSTGETEAFGEWAIAVTADGTTADYADSIGELRERATNQAEHDATQAAIDDFTTTAVLPVIGYVDRRVSESTIPLFVGETEDVVITCVDGNTGETIDVEAMTLELVVETRIKGDVKVYADNELTKQDNTVRFTPTSAMVTSERTLNFALRQSGTKAVVVYGIMTVTYAPRSGTS